MGKDIKVSVLIASFNSESTIKRAINSILRQTYEEFELIVLDDGSTDNTKDVINSITDTRLKYIYQDNEGIASSRNRLLSEAKGDYVIYLDSDDWMESNTLERLINKANESDCDAVVCNYRYVYEDGLTQDVSFPSFDKKNMKNRPSLLLDVMPQPWNKIVKRKAMIDSNISFPNGLVFEDLCFYSCLMPRLNNVSMIEDCLINYVQHKTSIMSEAKSINKNIYDFDKVVEIIKNYYAKEYPNKYQKEVEALFVFNAREIIDGIFKNKNVSIDEKEKAISSVLNTINNTYSNWYRNEYYCKRNNTKGFIYCIKRRIIDKLLAKEKYKIVLEKVIK